MLNKLQLVMVSECSSKPILLSLRSQSFKLLLHLNEKGVCELEGQKYMTKNKLFITMIILAITNIPNQNVVCPLIIQRANELLLSYQSVILEFCLHLPINSTKES